MNQRLLDVFENCLIELEKGATIDECLLKYPDLADDLRPSLEAAMLARSLSVAEFPSNTLNRSRTQVLGHAARMRADKKRKSSFLRFPSIAFTALLIALVFILGSRELAVVSAESLPGDRLYPIKRAVENLRVQFAPNQEIEYEMEVQYRKKRIQEVYQIIDQGWSRAVSFEGIVQELTPSKWVVDDMQVVLTNETKIIGEIHPGSVVEVEGITNSQGWIEAHELHLREYQFIGKVESIEESSWQVAGSTFELLSFTQIDSSIQLGDTVIILARSQDDGSHAALAILHLPDELTDTVPPLRDNISLIAGKEVGDVFEITGIVESITASAWVIDGYSVTTIMLTEIQEGIKVGDYVKIRIILGENGVLFAQEIEMAAENDAGEKDGSDHQNDGSEEDGQSGSGEESSEPGDDSSSGSGEDQDEKPEHTATPQVTLEPQETPEPEQTVEPEETETPEETEEPEETEQPEGTDEPDETEHPDETEPPDETEEPEETEGLLGIPGTNKLSVAMITITVEAGGKIYIS